MITLLKRLSPLYLCTIIFVASFIVYANTLPNQLFYDDEDFIYKNEYVKTFNFPKFFSENMIAGAGKTSNYYRPALMTSFALQHALFGLSPFIYHLTSLLLHAASAILIFLLLNKLFNKYIAFFSSLLFAVHPLQTEAVSYAAGQGDPLSLFFVLLAILLSFSSKIQTKLLSFLFLVLALLSKELALIAPGLLFISHLTHSKKLSKSTVITSFKTSVPYFAISLFYFFLRITVLNFQNTLNFYNGKNIYTQNILVRVNTFLNLLPKYIALLFYPNILFIERPATVFISITLITVITIIAIIALGIISLKLFRKSPILFFSLAWFFIGFIPTSGIIPINGIFYEHFIYYPSIGFFTLFASLILLLLKVQPLSRLNLVKNLLVILLIPYVLFFSLRTIQRNNDWHDPITFYNQTLKHSKSARLYNNLAIVYAENGESQKAIEVYNKAIAEGDFYPQTRYNLANAYIALGDFKKAEEEYKNALKIDKTFYLAYLKLFEIYKNTNNEKGVNWVIQEVEKLAKQNKSFESLSQQLQSVK